MRWRPASERLSNHRERKCCRNIGTDWYWTGMYNKSAKKYLQYTNSPDPIKVDIDKVEWLDEQGDAIPADLEQRAKAAAARYTEDHQEDFSVLAMETGMEAKIIEEWSRDDYYEGFKAAFLAGVESITVDYAEVEDDHKRLVRELDEIINGKDGMAKQASLCDIVAQLRKTPITQSIVDELRNANPYKEFTNGDKTGKEGDWLKYNCSLTWNQCVAVLQELLNQKEAK